MITEGNKVPDWKRRSFRLANSGFGWGPIRVCLNLNLIEAVPDRGRGSMED